MCQKKKGGGGDGGQLTFGGVGIKIWWGNFSKFLAGGNFGGANFCPSPSRENQQNRRVGDMEFPEVLKK